MRDPRLLLLGWTVWHESVDIKLHPPVNVHNHTLEGHLMVCSVLVEEPAGDPLGCRCPDIEKSIASEFNETKRVLLVLNKVDLIPRCPSSSE